MSTIQTLGQQIAALSSGAQASATQLYGIANNLRKTTEAVQQVMQGTMLPDYRTLVNQMQEAQKKLAEAAACLIAASNSGTGWLSGHTVNGAGAPASGQYTQHSSGDSQDASPAYFTEIDKSTASQEYAAVVTPLQQDGVAYRPIQSFGRERTAEEIISRLGGGDKTRGSCSSLAFAYAGNVAGYDVLDFRDGDSRRFFSKNGSIKMITELPGVDALIFNGKNDIICTNDLLKTMQQGKEYYLATGLHAAIVRKVDQHYEYLELQHPTDNGWHVLNDAVLLDRFGCEVDNDRVLPNFLMDVESLANCNEFLGILGYLNTAETEQQKGGDGYVR